MEPQAFKLLLIGIAAIVIMIILVVLWLEGKVNRKELNQTWEPGTIVAIDTGDGMMVAEIVTVMDYSVQVRSRRGRLMGFGKSAVKEASEEQVMRFKNDQI